MNLRIPLLGLVMMSAAFTGCAAIESSPVAMSAAPVQENRMKLGVFSNSLAVKDLAASRAFYEHLGFKQVAGNPEQSWIILQNDTTTIGLFQGMFDKNIMTFNPGWTLKQETLSSFTDVRDLQRALIDAGITPILVADESTTGPASFMIVDPDGNQILFDQHVASPGS